MLNVIYTLKACLLFLYYRLTIGTRQNLWVKIAGYYVATGWTATEIAFFTACRPFNGYWAVPPPDPQCTTLQHYAIIQACFNLSSDMMMLLIALPMVLSLKVPLKQKIVLAVVFSMGIFVVSSDIVPKTIVSNRKAETDSSNSDHSCHPHQSIQSVKRLRYLIHDLVYSRSIRRGLRHQPAFDLAVNARVVPFVAQHDIHWEIILAYLRTR